MDNKFSCFEKWFLDRKNTWKQKGISVDEYGLSEYGQQYWIKLHSNNGLANIVLYESNGYYWVDFEGGNYFDDVMYQKSGIVFREINDLELYENEIINLIAQKDE